MCVSVQECTTDACVQSSRAYLHRLQVLVSESERVGVAKLAENLPRGLMSASLNEQLVQEEKSCDGTQYTHTHTYHHHPCMQNILLKYMYVVDLKPSHVMCNTDPPV